MSELVDLLRQGSLTAKEITERLRITQSTLSRRLARVPEIIKIGKSRSTRYILPRPLDNQWSFPLYQINEAGNAVKAGTLYSIWPGESCAVETASGQSLIYDGLPWFITDMRPQGFLGRAWGRDINAALHFSDDIKIWSESQTLVALARAGDETVGNFVIGEIAYQRWFHKPEDIPVPREDKVQVYERLAQRSLAGEEIGSSAGGEQPKFSCYTEHEDRDASQVLVKFSSPAINENACRWGDLLRSEAHALKVLQAAGIPAATADIFTGRKGEVFLEVERFDRVGERGRRGLVSLEAVSAEFGGGNSNWFLTAQQLRRGRVITSATLERIEQIYAFGKLIANSDMHQGNLSFIDPATDPLKQALSISPVYDMLPMAFAPTNAGTMRRETVPLTLDPLVSKEKWLNAQKWASEFWRNVESDMAISVEFRHLASGMLAQVEELTSPIQRLA
ncbi:type II toxin-antitoxin system HipA family toxin YjjJ [Rahnella sp. AN3-3W3]|uniref:type II toxin-antitoxin system HipA family toxin YjjJ n=1 Tax=Rahnella sp. AN3-3W3 TaxID=1610578 RepID=UPI000DD49B2F|nr:type II toxin-antitoxin system HipA family toxin YjjJ [Rahnella sp. AN3-3W3]